jgi:hypothetical protein
MLMEGNFRRLIDVSSAALHDTKAHYPFGTKERHALCVLRGEEASFLRFQISASDEREP